MSNFMEKRNKNIHVLPTDKPSKLFIGRAKKELFVFDELANNVPPIGQNQNIYITSDEEITNCDCYVINVVGEISRRTVFKPIKVTEDIVRKEPLITYPNGGWCKKIILTTDQDLIKNGVQDIDDDFLEWFVKNPSCEEVEIRYTFDFNSKAVIIIPKEKPKQEITIEEIEQQITITEARGERVVKYLDKYIGQSIYNEIALAIEFGYQLKLEEDE